ncbi:Cenp-O kinetochore centromere component-domain-containing protein [Microdochium trichocladiopsis]|uniref:Cenp-O kinetochore centromere component-domain-containing protein n=1 Tax=Microdochium trichocladiopsis TaxID=1682393 RepID=A0A9P9BU91_9PEZI|nr:Cenp-O kinetochore centromere component-domain-containing protein [Microdochium trichocladiopsis]KAH7037376.1 Cenp-O kinetochore centromere component-domain-containing protein [Microdochium trichocladiopsis]
MSENSELASSPAPTVADLLNDEIAKLRAQVESLKRDVALHSSTLLATPAFVQSLEQQISQPKAKQRRTRAASQKTQAERLLVRAKEQQAHAQQSLYRMCASVTTFRVTDPDPNAVDNGNVLGIRFEVMSHARFLKPYFVMLNRPYTRSKALRVHRHTVPPSIPLGGLAARYLPAPKGDRQRDDRRQNEARQDLPRFVRTLRRELVRFHNRTSVISDLRDATTNREPDTSIMADGDDSAIVNIQAADAEAKQVSIEWADGRAGRLVMNDNGEIVKMVVQAEQGRDRETVRGFLGGATRVEEVVDRMKGAATGPSV